MKEYTIGCFLFVNNLVSNLELTEASYCIAKEQYDWDLNLKPTPSGELTTGIFLPIRGKCNLGF